MKNGRADCGMPDIVAYRQSAGYYSGPMLVSKLAPAGWAGAESADTSSDPSLREGVISALVRDLPGTAER